MTDKKAKGAKPVKAWAVVRPNGEPGNRRKADYLWILWSKKKAAQFAVDGERVVRVLVTPLESMP